MEKHKEDILWLQYIQSCYGQYTDTNALEWENHFTKNQTDTNFSYLMPYTYVATLKVKSVNKLQVMNVGSKTFQNMHFKVFHKLLI